MVAVILNLVLPQEPENQHLLNDFNDTADVESQEGNTVSPL